MIKNDDGTPKAVYHFSENMEFENFAKGDIGFHFGNYVQAERHSKGKSGRIIVAHLDIKNPIRFRSDLMFWSPRNTAFMLQVEGVISIEERLYIEKIADGEVINDVKEMYSSKSATELRRILAEKGYDGIVYQNMFEGDGESYIAFYPEQVIIIDDGRGGGSNNDVAVPGEEANSDLTIGQDEKAPTGITELSPADKKKDAFQKATESVTGYKELTEEQKTIRDIGRKLGWKVVFAPVKTPKGSMADGKISFATKTITINPASKKPIQFILKHELAHSLEQNKGAYAELQNAIMDSKVFKDYVKAQGFDSAADYNADIVARYKAEGVEGFDSARAEYKANCEMVANFVGDCLFGGNTEVTAKLLEGMNTAQRRSFVQWVKDFFAKIKAKLTGKHEGLTDEISKLEDAFLKTLNSVKQKENTAIEDGESYAINYFETSDVDIESNMQELAKMSSVYNVKSEKLEKTGKKPSELFSDFFDSLGNSIYVKQFGDIALSKSSVKSEIRHGITAEKIASIEAIPTVLKQGKIIFAERKSGSDVDRIVVCAPIKIGEKPYYMGVMLQRDTQNQRLYLHNVIIEEEMSNASQADLLTTGALEENEHLSMTNILQKALSVKNKYMQENENYSISTEYSLKNVLEQVEKGEISAKEAETLLSRKKTLNPAVEVYTEEQYNNFGWVRANDVLTAAEHTTLLSRYADFKHNKDKYPVTRFGETVIHSTECPDVLMYVKGNIRNPQITKIVRIDADSYNASIIMEWILENEYNKIQQPYSAIETVFGEELFSISRKRDFISFQKYQAEQEGRGGKSGDTASRSQQDRRGSITEGEGTNNGNGGVKSLKFSAATTERNNTETDTSTDFAALRKELLERYKNGEITEQEFSDQMDALWERAINENGQIKPGENVAPQNKSVAVPKSASEGTKVRELVRTVLESGYATPEMEAFLKSMILRGEFSFEPTSDKARLDKAEESINKQGYQKALEQWQGQIHNVFAKDENLVVEGEALLKLAMEHKRDHRDGSCGLIILQ